MLARAGLFYRTLRHVPLSQLWFYVLRRGLSVNPFVSHPMADKRLDVRWLQLNDPLPTVEATFREGRFHFLNQDGASGPENPDWRSADMPKLWRYHLHYFDWLRDEKPDHALYGFLMDHWIFHNPVGSIDAWEPYTVSMRLMNWIRYCYRRRQQGLLVKPEWIQSIRQQGHWLSRNVEYHIRANHLLKNRIALAWFALFRCADSASRQQLFYNLNLLQAELIEQFNQDGGHYERSPSYHALCIELCIALYDALQAADVVAPVCHTLRDVIEKGIVYQKAISFSDGKVALIGDSTLHGAHDVRCLQDYWLRVCPGAVAESEPSPGLFYLKDTGFVIWKTPVCKLIISLSGPAPAYQPGHSHCDAGSFELELDGKRIVVDSGVSQYAAGEMRNYVRSSRAHNVLSIAEQDQSEIWGEFRVGARIVIENVSVQQDKDGATISINMRSHKASAVPYQHQRVFRLSACAVEISDSFSFVDVAKVNSRLHFNPGYEGTFTNGQWAFQSACGTSISLEVQGAEEQTLEPSFYCPDFGVVTSNQCLLLSQLSTQQGSMVIRIAVPEAYGVLS